MNNSGKENQEQKQHRSIFRTLYGIVTALAVIASLSVSTYAWFTLNSAVNVTPLTANIGAADGSLLICEKKDPTETETADGKGFRLECDLSVDSKTLDKQNELLPVSTSDLDNFFIAGNQSPAGIVTSYLKYTVKDGDYSNDTRMLHGRVYLKSANTASEVYLLRSVPTTDASGNVVKDANGNIVTTTYLTFGSDVQLQAAMRLGLRFAPVVDGEVQELSDEDKEKNTFIFKLDDMGLTGTATSQRTVTQAGCVITSAAGGTKADPAKNLSDYMASATWDEKNNEVVFSAGKNASGENTTPFLTIGKDEIYQVEFWLYLEGCDDECCNAAQTKDLSFQLGFCGLTPNTDDDNAAQN